MNNTIYVNILHIDSRTHFQINLSEDKTVFHYLNKKLGPDFLKFNSPDDNLHFFGDTPNGELKKGTKARVIFGLKMLTVPEDSTGNCRGFEPEVNYVLAGEVGEEFVDDGKIILRGNNDINEFLNNGKEGIIIRGYRRNERGGYNTRPPVENENGLEYLFIEGALFGVDAYSKRHHGTERVIVLRDYRDMFTSLFNGYKGVLSPKNLFEGSGWDEKGKRDERFDALIPNTSLNETIAIDEIVDGLYPILSLKHEEAVRQEPKHR